MTARQRMRSRADYLRAVGRCVASGCGEPLDYETALSTCWRCRERWAGRYLALREIRMAYRQAKQAIRARGVA